MDLQGMKEPEWCSCGLVKDHKSKCLGQKLEKKEKIGKYSGPSKTPYGKYEER